MLTLARADTDTKGMGKPALVNMTNQRHQFNFEIVDIEKVERSIFKHDDVKCLYVVTSYCFAFFRFVRTNSSRFYPITQKTLNILSCSYQPLQ